MQILRDDKYHTQINHILLNGGLKFHSNYCLWVYVFLKLWQYFYLQRSICKKFSVDYDLLGKLFSTSRTTLSSAVHELVDAGLLTKIGFNKFILVDENKILSIKGKKEFVKVYNNHFMEMLNAGVSIRQLNIYYHLVYATHNLADENGFSLSQDTQTSVTKKLRSRGPEVKIAIDGLINLRLVEKDKKGRLCVKTQKGDVKTPKSAPWLREEQKIEVEIIPKDESNIKNVISHNNEFYELDNNGKKYRISGKGEKFQLKTKEDYETELRVYKEKFYRPFKDINENKQISKQIRELEGYIEAIIRLEEFEELCCDDEN